MAADDTTFTYEPGSGEDRDRVRLLINDVDADHPVFDDAEIAAFLDLEGAVRLAAAQALDTVADNEALTSKVLRTQDLATDGAKLADSLRRRAQALRDQHDREVDAADDGFFEIIDGGRRPEHTNRWL